MNYKSEEIKKYTINIYYSFRNLFNYALRKINLMNLLLINFDNRINHIYFTNNNELDNIYNYLKNNDLLVY